MHKKNSAKKQKLITLLIKIFCNVVIKTNTFNFFEKYELQVKIIVIEINIRIL